MLVLRSMRSVCLPCCAACAASVCALVLRMSLRRSTILADAAQVGEVLANPVLAHACGSASRAQLILVLDERAGVGRDVLQDLDDVETVRRVDHTAERTVRQSERRAHDLRIAAAAASMRVNGSNSRFGSLSALEASASEAPALTRWIRSSAIALAFASFFCRAPWPPRVVHLRQRRHAGLLHRVEAEHIRRDLAIDHRRRLADLGLERPDAGVGNDILAELRRGSRWPPGRSAPSGSLSARATVSSAAGSSRSAASRCSESVSASTLVAVRAGQLDRDQDVARGDLVAGLLVRGLLGDLDEVIAERASRTGSETALTGSAKAALLNAGIEPRRLLADFAEVAAASRPSRCRPTPAWRRPRTSGRRRSRRAPTWRARARPPSRWRRARRGTATKLMNAVFGREKSWLCAL